MEFRLPELGEGVYEAEVVRWLVKPGDAVQRAQPLLEVLTDKATMEVPAAFVGTIETLAVEAGQQVKIGDVLLNYGNNGAAAKAEPPAAPVQTAEAKPAANGPVHTPTPAHVKASPAVRQQAHKLGIDLTTLTGSGPQGRILAEDLARSKTSPAAATPAAATPAAATPAAATPAAATQRGSEVDFGQPGTRIKLQGLRRKIAEHMVQSKQTIPHYTYVDECEVTELVQLRESLRETLAQKGVRLTFLAFFVKAVVDALREVPIVNSSLDDKAGEIVVHDAYHIGIAVATPGGLIVPVIRDAHRRSLLDIAGEVERLSSDARAGKSRLEDLRGGTFTITSIGSVGGLFATPIIHQPQVAILGIGKVVKRPVFDEHDRVRPASMVYLSLTCDHRVLDGAVAAAFGNSLIKHLRKPAALIVE